MKKVLPKLMQEKKKRRCRICRGNAGLIRKYNLYICRRCFKDIAEKLGFKKFD
ncbi:MAG TPA: 30S ribosomal protein S14 [archaeon]|nr:30S ribosomal protein S14 [archaeon]